MSVRTEPCLCPWCSALISGASDADGDDEDLVPNAGDWSVCFYCARLSVFREDLSLRKATPVEAVEAVGDEDLARAISFAKTHGPRDPGRWPSA